MKSENEKISSVMVTGISDTEADSQTYEIKPDDCGPYKTEAETLPSSIKLDDGVNPSVSVVPSIDVRWWKLRDIPAIKRLASDPKLAAAAGWDPVRTWKQAFDRVVFGYPKPWCYAIVDKDRDLVIGSVSFMQPAYSHLPISAGELEMGYWLAESYRGNGLVVKAAGILLDEMFFVRNIERVWLVIDKDNRQSHRVQEKLGFRYNKTKDIYMDHLERKVTSHIFSLDKGDWRSWNL